MRPEQRAANCGTQNEQAPNRTTGGKPMLVAASSYPFLNVLWDILIIFAWILFIWIAIVVFTDIFRRRDIGGWGKAGWVILIVILPWIGVLIYLIANHDGMAERTEKQNQAAQAQLDQYVRQTAGTGGPAAEIETAKKLLDSGAITQAEFDAIKAKALGSAAGSR
jgi:Short C-terminal domain/Phospholipase_D-nuclease N-terminal